MGKFIEMENRLVIARALEEEMTAHGYRVSFSSDKNIPETYSVWLYNLVNILKTTELYALKGLFCCMWIISQ